MESLRRSYVVVLVKLSLEGLCLVFVLKDVLTRTTAIIKGKKRRNFPFAPVRWGIAHA